MEIAHKVCPVVTRRRNGRLELLAFRHPQDGFQIVKGTVEPGEPPARAAMRELWEESGVTSARPPRLLLRTRIGRPRLRWSLYLVAAPPLPDRWSRITRDDHRYCYRFFWHPLALPPGAGWPRPYREAAALLRAALLRR